MFPTLLYLQLLVAHPAPVVTAAIPRAAVQFDVTLKDLDATQVAGLLGDGLPAAVRDRFRGRIGRVVVSVNGDAMTLKADGFRMPGDWVSRAEGTMDLKTREYKAKLWAFGGLVEFTGTMPTEEAISRTRAKGTSLTAK
jgi:hypothetical protein